ncbi:endonuclease/exonuclease/phosphatase family protein [Lunatibacter salilacus]|uniref:endonuclease/exonuclease/phosphatase family protein n=1 Tax=Lunatibacter salilacus TaxID=2483804 RepID=UPI001F3A4254|nr:endonuclease/exonuclease/phosphatase family protein [Lunatibacter salilacus]
MNLITVIIAILFSAIMSGKPVDTSSPEKPTLKVLCYNIHYANPPSKDKNFIDMDAIAKVINDHNPDVVALQEVDVNINRSGNIDQAKILAEKTGMKAYYFGKAIDHDGGDYGVAILSKFDLRNTQTLSLPADPETNSEPRVLATAEIRTDDGFDFVFGVTHLEVRHETNRLMQMEAIVSFAEKSSLPMIVAGDFNAKPDSRTIEMLDVTFKRTCEDCAPTIPVINPNRAIDFIAFSPQERFKVIQHMVIPETYASDHLPVFAELEIQP